MAFSSFLFWPWRILFPTFFLGGQFRPLLPQRCQGCFFSYRGRKKEREEAGALTAPSSTFSSEWRTPLLPSTVSRTCLEFLRLFYFYFFFFALLHLLRGFPFFAVYFFVGFSPFPSANIVSFKYFFFSRLSLLIFRDVVGFAVLVIICICVLGFPLIFALLPLLHFRSYGGASLDSFFLADDKKDIECRRCIPPPPSPPNLSCQLPASIFPLVFQCVFSCSSYKRNNCVLKVTS